MSRIFVVYGHHNVNKSFNQEIRDTFCSEAKKLGHEIDLINLHEEKPIPFYDGSEPSEQILDYRKRLEQSDVLFMISPCYNLRATAILENWIDLVLPLFSGRGWILLSRRVPLESLWLDLTHNLIP